MKISVDSQLAERLARRADRHGFNSGEAYALVVLETVLDELEAGAEHDDDVERRLEDLGYL